MSRLYDTKQTSKYEFPNAACHTYRTRIYAEATHGELPYSYSYQCCARGCSSNPYEYSYEWSCLIIDSHLISLILYEYGRAIRVASDISRAALQTQSCACDCQPLLEY
eukprot:scaffold399499_cov22-Prasinocladus_malaysianus.AAC.1